jgi:hypothetical protein
MIPHPITWGHVLLLAAVLVGLYGLVQLGVWARYRSFGRGTPQYARRRDGKRFAIWALLAAALLAAIGCLTPLCEMALV